MAFAFVYTSEAHASDEWPVGHEVIVNQPKTSSERVALAQEKLADLGVSDEFIRMVDPVDNKFHNRYACWPLRWYTVGAGGRRLTSIAQPRNSGYDVKELVGWVVEQAA